MHSLPGGLDCIGISRVILFEGIGEGESVLMEEEGHTIFLSKGHFNSLRLTCKDYLKDS